MPYSDGEKQKSYQRDWVRQKRARLRESEKRYTHKLRRKVIQLLGGKCVNCGCNNYNALEINHKNGDGNKERRKTSYKQFYLNILSGRRKTDDLEIRCIVCNALHKAQKIHNLNEKWIVTWRPKVTKMKKFKHAPKGIPSLTEEQWKILEEVMNRPMTEKDKELWRRAQKVYHDIKQIEKIVGD